MEEKKPARGGARPGSGPTPADGARGMTRVNISIDEASDQIAKDLGEGDRSLGIRRALKIAHEVKSGTHKPVRKTVRSTQPVRTANQPAAKKADTKG